MDPTSLCLVSFFIAQFLVAGLGRPVPGPCPKPTLLGMGLHFDMLESLDRYVTAKHGQHEKISYDRSLRLIFDFLCETD